jgi:hypothetical protein
VDSNSGEVKMTAMTRHPDGLRMSTVFSKLYSSTLLRRSEADYLVITNDSCTL